MVFLESLIFFLGIFIMYRGQKRQTELIESIIYNPDYAAAVANGMLWGVMADISQDEKKQKIFYAFVGQCLKGSLEHFKSRAGVDIDKPIKTGNKMLDGLVNMPAIKQALATKVQQVVENKAVQQVEEAVAGW